MKKACRYTFTLFLRLATFQLDGSASENRPLLAVTRFVLARDADGAALSTPENNVNTPNAATMPAIPTFCFTRSEGTRVAQ